MCDDCEFYVFLLFKQTVAMFNKSKSRDCGVCGTNDHLSWR